MLPSTIRPIAVSNLWKYSLPIVKPKLGQYTPPIQTQARSATILPNFVGLKFQVHNGKIYHEFTVTEDMVGHKLGEFSPYVDGITFGMEIWC
jgi:ribosomal protein S19